MTIFSLFSIYSIDVVRLTLKIFFLGKIFFDKTTFEKPLVPCQQPSRLANLGLGETDKANNEFTKALEYNPDHVWSKVYLDDVKLKIILPH